MTSPLSPPLPSADVGVQGPSASVSFTLLRRLHARRPANSADGLERLDALVLAVARDCDKAAFADRFSHVGPLLKSWLIRSGSSPSAADDLVQDTFVLVWHKAHQFDPAVRAWQPGCSPSLATFGSIAFGGWATHGRCWTMPIWRRYPASNARATKP